MPGHGRQFTLTQIAGDNLAEVDAPPTVTFAEREQVVGRSERADLGVAVTTVSRRHAAVWIANGIPTIKDLDSAHGTFVNDKRILQPTVLRQGDLIALGHDATFLVGVIESAEMQAAERAQMANEGATDSRLSELALTDVVAPETLKERLAALRRVAGMCARSSTEKELYDHALSELQRHLDADRLTVLSGPTADVLTPVADRRSAPFAPDAWPDPSAAVVRRAVISGRPVVCFDLRTDTRFVTLESVADGPVRSVACMPMGYGGEVLGVLYADSLRAPGMLGLDDVYLMQLVGHYVAARLLQLRLGHQLEELHMEIHEEASKTDELVESLAADIQSHLNRLEMIADDAELEQGRPGLARLMRAECERLRSDVDRNLCWSKVDETQPVIVDEPLSKLQRADPDAEDRSVSAEIDEVVPRPIRDVPSSMR